MRHQDSPSLEAGKIWLCLTTLGHRRFVEDAIHAVALPRGTHIRLRYRRPYVSRQLWNDISSRSFPAANDERVLIALCATRDDGSSRIAPLREGRLVSVRCEGSLLVADVAVVDFVNERGVSDSFLMELQSKVRDLPTTFEYQKGASPTYLQCIDFVPETILISSKVSAWERAANAFFEVDAIGTIGQGGERHGVVPFLFYVSNLTSSVAKRLESSGRLDVEAGHRLKFEVHTLTSPDQNALKDPLGEIRFELSQAACNFESSRRVRIDSRRDVRAITITTTALFRRIGGHLSIRTVLFQGKDLIIGQDQLGNQGMTPAKHREELVIARYDFPLKVGRWMPWIAAGLVSLAAAAAVLKIPDSGSFTIKAVLMPALVFALAMLGIVLGLKNDSKR